MRTLSHVLLCIEATVLIIPTLFGLIMGINVLVAALSGKLTTADLTLLLMLLCMLALLVLGWYVLFQRLVNGPLALRNLPPACWIAAAGGAVLSIVGYLLQVQVTQSRFAFFSLAIFGVPTFIHLTLETWVWPPNNRSSGREI
jgi:hypothetical protein